MNLTVCLLQNIDGLDYRKNFFLFLSNTGGKEITQTALDSWNRGKEREKISVMDLEHLSKLLCLMRSLAKSTRLCSCAFLLVVNAGKLGPRDRSQAQLTGATWSDNNTE